jgi:hypothetical protein
VGNVDKASLLLVFLFMSPHVFAQEDVQDVTPPAVLDFKVSPTTFSPNGDGVDDVVRITATLSEPAHWYVDVRNSEGEGLCIENSHGSVIDLEWDGYFPVRGADGFSLELMPGTYTIIIKAFDGAMNKAEASATVELTIPTTTSPPETPEAPVDSDGDGWTDEFEKLVGTSPFDKDTDGDGIWDPGDPDPLGSSVRSEVTIEPHPPSHLISNLGVSPRTITPDGDGVDDYATITARTSEEVEWRIIILDAEKMIPYVDVNAGRGRYLEEEWDGYSEVIGMTVPDGKYLVNVYARGKRGVDQETATVAVLGSPTPSIPVEELKVMAIPPFAPTVEPRVPVPPRTPPYVNLTFRITQSGVVSADSGDEGMDEQSKVEASKADRGYSDSEDSKEKDQNIPRDVEKQGGLLQRLLDRVKGLLGRIFG